MKGEAASRGIRAAVSVVRRLLVFVLAATHQHLEERVKAGLFREVLFHRLNVIRIHLPALRERREDIPILTRHFLKRAAQEMEMEPKLLRPEVADYMRRLDWAGNTLTRKIKELGMGEVGGEDEDEESANN